MPGGFALATKRSACPCGGGRYGDCCGPLHRDEQLALTAEQLMRARFSAFALAEVNFLLCTHPQPQIPDEQRRRQLVEICRQTRWLELRIISTHQGQFSDLVGIVTFEARFRDGSQRGVLKETSLFQREGMFPAGAWLYIKALNIEN